MKVMFLDESGNHSLKPKHLAGNFPIFVLGGVIVDRAHVRDVIEPDMNRFKEHYFGRRDVLLHTVDMNDGTGEYGFLADEATRDAFYGDLHHLLRTWEYNVIACVIKKPELVAKYGPRAEDPYRYSLHIVTERFCKELGEGLDSGFICAEKRGGNLDHQLMQEWEAIRTKGTAYVSSKTIDDRIVSLDLRDKKPNLAGMQLADLVITPIGRHVLGTPPKPNRVQWDVVEKKLCRTGTKYLGIGLVIRP